MVKELLKASIIGASIIVSTFIYTNKVTSVSTSSNQNKYAFISSTGGNYSVLNQETGEVQLYRIVDGPMEGYRGEPFLAKYYTHFDTNNVTRMNGKLIHIDLD